ncbi:MAG: LysR substrate-binding domain-containing protein [Burkholderiaceae bacterium]
MNLQQLRYLREIVRCDLNLTRAAERLHTSQPGISRRILELEEELGVEIFVRKGRRLTGLTAAGQSALALATQALEKIDALSHVAANHDDQAEGVLTIATTHTQARYTLPPVIKAFRERYPNVSVVLKQSDPVMAARRTLDGEADLAMATEVVAGIDGLRAHPCLTWSHVALMLPDHPLAVLERINLGELADTPLLTYDSAFAGRTSIDRVFAEHGLTPRIAMTALDADVIKTYVRMGLGVGLVAALAFDPLADAPLIAKDCAHLFGHKTSFVAVRVGSSQRGFIRDFLHLLAPDYPRDQAAGPGPG